MINLTGCSTVNNSSNLDQKSLYAKASKSFHFKDYENASKSFKSFLFETEKSSKFYKDNKFTAIDYIVEINLKHSKSPSKNIQFLERVIAKVPLNDSEDDSVDEWLGVSKKWNEILNSKKDSLKPEEHFSLGEKYYDLGMRKILYPADPSGNADFYIASRYLTTYVFENDRAKNIGKALFMLGNIKVRTLVDDEYWSENYYLKEVIRRFPHTKLAQKSYLILEESIIGGYTGSAGTEIPLSQKEMLIKYKKMSSIK